MKFVISIKCLSSGWPYTMWHKCVFNWWWSRKQRKFDFKYFGLESSKLLRVLGPQIHGRFGAAFGYDRIFTLFFHFYIFYLLWLIIAINLTFFCWTLFTGTKEPTRKVKAMTKLSNKPDQLPRNFNAVEDDKWRGYISRIYDQGWCGASWAISTASVASDRFGIQTKGKEAVELAPQHLLSCVQRRTGCSGGHLDWAWNYIRKIG